MKKIIVINKLKNIIIFSSHSKFSTQKHIYIYIPKKIYTFRPDNEEYISHFYNNKYIYKSLS